MEAIIPCYQALQACRVLCFFFLFVAASLTGAKGSSTNRRGRGSGSEGMPTPMNESTSQQMGLAFVTCLRRPFGRGYHGRQGLSGTQ